MSECLERCDGCPFKYGPLVGSKGNPNAPFMIIGESPGRMEVKEGLPFVGPSGELLHKTLTKLGVKDDEVYFTNAFQCYPGRRDDKKEDDLKKATSLCRKRLLDEILRAPRKVILPLGAPAIWSVFGNDDLKITQNRGRYFRSDLASIGIVPSVHPAFLMAGGKGGTYQQWMRDLEYSVSLLRGGAPKSPPKVNWELARDHYDVQDYANSIQADEVVAGDIETSGFSFLSDRILCTGYSRDPRFVLVIPEHLTWTNKYILRKSKVQFLWHNGQFDVKFLWENGFEEARIDHDTILQSYSLDENGGIHSLDQVASDWLNSPNWKSVLDEYLPKKNISYDVIPRPILHQYMAYDIGNTRAIHPILYPRIMADKHLSKLYHNVLIPATNFLARVERNGLYADRQRIRENEVAYDIEVQRFGNEIREIAKQFPDSGYTEKLVGSWKQLQKLLYDDLKIKPYKNQRGTGKEILDKLPQEPIIVSLRKYRKVAKEKSTYVTPAAENIDKDGAVHSSLSLFKTATGRLASSDPNVQNIPRNPQIRGQYIARPGRRLVEADLNQAELRVLAILSGDVKLCHIYTTEGMSLHDEVRAEIFGWPKDYSPQELAKQLDKFRLTPETRFDEHGEDLLIAEQKMRAKNINFGIPYGISPPGLAEQTGSNIKDAAIWIDTWMKTYKGAADFLNACKAAPSNGQVLITPFGNKRRFGVVSNERLISLQNQAMNFPEQSSASHMTLLSGVELLQPLKIRYDSHIINLIHDAILVDAPDDDDICKEVAREMITVMERIPKDWGFLRVPFKAEAKQGYRWGSLTKLKV